MATYMQGALKAGAGFSENPSGFGVGFAMFTQSKTNSGISGLTQDITFELPPGSQLIAIIPDVLTAYDSATSATLSVGTTSGGTQYASAINAKTAGRAAVGLDEDQLRPGGRGGLAAKRGQAEKKRERPARSPHGSS